MGDINRNHGIEKVIASCIAICSLFAAAAAFELGSTIEKRTIQNSSILVPVDEKHGQALNQPGEKARMETTLAHGVNDYFAAQGLPVDPGQAGKTPGETLAKAKGRASAPSPSNP